MSETLRFSLNGVHLPSMGFGQFYLKPGRHGQIRPVVLIKPHMIALTKPHTGVLPDATPVPPLHRF